MGKNKLSKFSQLGTFQRVYQPEINEILNKDFYLKGSWGKSVFKNDNPIILELGCGKGEYTVNQAIMHRGKNFIGVDIKGSRIWNGAKTVQENGLENAAFLRTRIEFIESFFANNEISEIWITFPDPQLKKRRNKKRLTGSAFLNRYSTFLKDEGIIHLKTDNDILYNYTRDLVIHNECEIIADTNDLYNASFLNEMLSIKTYYEKQFLAQGLTIKYISFRLKPERRIIEAHEED